MMLSGACQLLLLMVASAHVTTGLVNITGLPPQNQVDEDVGSFNVCISADRTLCINIISCPNDAEDGKDYHRVAKDCKIGSGMICCVEIFIVDDNTPELLESFTLKCSEMDVDSAQCNGMEEGSGSGEDSMMPIDMLHPIFNETVKISIKDNDFIIVTVSAAVSGFIVLLFAFVIITLLCCAVARWRRKKGRRRRGRGHDGVDGSYIEFNPILMGERRDVEEEGSTEHIHAAIADVKLAEFAAYVKKLHKDADHGFSLQYKALQAHSPKFSCRTAELKDNDQKNRYYNILPYDSTRVKVRNMGKKNSDYINASWMEGYKREKSYVACQGPLPETIPDFWHMIWELEIPTIVMLTKTMEATKVKCEQYWPNKVEESITLEGGMTVLLQEVVPFADYEMRKLLVSNGKEKRKVTHFYFLSWPDHGVPRYATALLGFIRHIRKRHFPSDPAPMVVHCSAGVGRTGTLIVLDIMLQALEAELGINVYQCILKLRAQRCFMVQTEAQYVFIHDALEELITCGKTEIAAGNLRIAMSRLSAASPDGGITGFQQQFQLVEKVSRQPVKRDLEISQKEFNTRKNRHPKKLPYDLHRVCLRVTGQPGSDYINASWVNGYRQMNAFMVTQGPLENTVNDIWRMVWEMNSRTIVMLCELRENNEEVCKQYWPELEKKQTYGNLTVSSKKEQALNEAVCSRVFDISRHGAAAAPVQEVITVTQFQFRGWPDEGLPSDPRLLLELLDKVLKNQISTGNRPIVVMCSDGCSRSGVFVVLYSQLERLKTEHVVDVFQGIKSARIQRMDIVHNVESYKLIHELLIEYITSFTESDYNNFKY